MTDLWLVAVSNGESYSDHAVTELVIVTSDLHAEVLADAIRQWIASRPTGDFLIGGVDKYKGMPLSPFHDQWPEWLAANPWPGPGTAPPETALGRNSEPYIIKLPLWATDKENDKP